MSPQPRLRPDHWTVGIVNEPAETLLRRPGSRVVNWLDTSAFDGFVADPFVTTINDEPVVFCEVFSFSDRSGRIAVASIVDGKLVPIAHDLFSDGVHRSYPQVFWHDDSLLLLPEQSALGRIDLYEIWDLEPITLRRRTSILEDQFSGLDCTLLAREGMWWLFASDTSAGASGALLNVFFADSPSGPWYPHPRNPVVEDIRRARPAGQLIQFPDGTLARPGQNCWPSYGTSIAVNIVETLTTTSYQEAPVAEIRSTGISYGSGVHTVNPGTGGWSIIDGKSNPINIGAACTRLRQRVRRKFFRISA